MEDLILVDIFDRPVGHKSKALVHRLGLLHRAFSVFICHNNCMLLQRRAKTKYHSGGLLTNACCSHPRYGESLTAAVWRRLYEELGVHLETRKLFHFIYRNEFSNGVIEYEYDHVFVSDSALDFVNPDPHEIDDIFWIDFPVLAKDLTNNPEQFTPWFVIATPKVMEYLQK